MIACAGGGYVKAQAHRAGDGRDVVFQLSAIVRSFTGALSRIAIIATKPISDTAARYHAMDMGLPVTFNISPK